MKPSFVQIIALLLCLVMLSTSVLTACSGGKDILDESSGESAESAVETNDTEETHVETSESDDAQESETEGVPAEPIRATGVSFDVTELTILVGETVTLNPILEPAGATDPNMTWRSANPAILTVRDGVVTAESAGAAVVSVFAGGKIATCKVTVENPPVIAAAISLDATAKLVEVGETFALTATISPADTADKSVTWASSDPTVATVEDGVVTALRAGTALVTAQTTNGKTATCFVTVAMPFVAVTEIALDRIEATVTVGDGLRLTATISPDGATDQTVTWHSSNEWVVTVEDGILRTWNMGTATVTAIAANGMRAACVVTVVGNAVVQYAPVGDDAYAVTGMEGRTDRLEIPSLHNGKPVVAIADSAFRGNTDLREVILPASLESIGARAFGDCPSLRSIRLPDGLVRLGDAAFENCTSLAEMVLPDTVTYVKYGCFANTAWWQNQRDGAVYSGRVFYGYKGTLDGGLDILDDTVCVALGALAGQTLSALRIPFVGAVPDGAENTHFGYIFGAETVDVQRDFLPSELTDVTVKKCQYTIADSAFLGCSAAVTLVHYWGAWTVLQDETCQNEGSKYRVCSVCAARDEAVVPIDPNAHSVSTVWTADAENHWHTCEIAGCEEVFSVVAHTWSAWVVTVDPTCQTAGSRYRVCTVCSYTATEVMDVDPDAHDVATDWTTDAENHWYVCKIEGCNETFSTAAHNWGAWVVTVEPTCQTAGSRYRVCTVCAYTVTEVMDVDPDAHDVATAWMTNAENHWYVCQNVGCDETFSTAAHNWGAWVVTVEPTCQTTGSRYHVCTVCDYIATEVIPIDPDAHDVATAWTTNAENHWHVCQNVGCDETFSAAAHTWGEWVVTVEPTCQTTGSRYHVCTVCDYIATEVIPIDPDAHTAASAWKTDADQHWHKCSISGCDADVEVVAHTWGVWVVTDESTCQTTGSRYHVCTVCNHTATEVMPIEPDAHDWNGEDTCAVCLLYRTENVELAFDREAGTYTVTVYTGSETAVVVPGRLNGYPVTEIGEGAFKNCATIESIVIPDSVTKIGKSAFYKCTALTSITLPFVGETKGGAENTYFGYIFGASGSNSNNTFVPATLRTVVITGGESIGANAFYGCKKLTNITLPDRLTAIGNNAFYNCSALTSMVIPDGVKSLGYGMFYGCTALTSIVIPESVTSVGNSAFNKCTSLATVYYAGTPDAWSGVTVGSNNNPLKAAAVYYYSASNPADTANSYWHYVGGEPAKW